MRRLKPGELALIRELAPKFPDDIFLRLSEGRYEQGDAGCLLEIRELLESAFCDSGLDANDNLTDRGRSIEALIEVFGPDLLDELRGRAS